MRIGRRPLLLSTLALVAAACTRAVPRPVVPTAAPPPEFERWNQEAQGILSDVLETLRTFDVFHAFRVGTAPESTKRLGSELAWDPPTSAAWEEATHVARGSHGRAEQLFLAVATATTNPDAFREHRVLAEAAHDLLDLADTLGAYRDRIDRLPPGDASSALGLLDRAWAQWDAAAPRWGVSRAEPIQCAS